MSVRAHRVEPHTPIVVVGEPLHWDYADAFDLTPNDSRSAEEWSRATLERGPIALRTFVMIGWRYVLLLRLGPKGSAQHIAGWPIVLNTPETVVIAVKSGLLGHARLTFRSGPSTVSASTNVAFERPGARAIWSVFGLLHRRILPYLLGHAARIRPAQ